MKKITLTLLILGNFFTTYSQTPTEQSPTWKIYHRSNIIYNGDTSKLDIVRTLNVVPGKDSDIVLKIIYSEQRKTSAKYVLSYLDGLDAASEGEFQDSTSLVEIHYSAEAIMKFAKMLGSKRECKVELTYRDNRFFKESTTLCVFVIPIK